MLVLKAQVEKGLRAMGDTQWENCGAETLLEEFFAQDDLRQLAESAGKILDCPLLVLDDTFHVAAYRLPQDSPMSFQNVVSCGEITYEAGVLISRSPALSEGRADFLQLPGSPYPRRFCAPCQRGGSSLAASSAWTRTDIWKKFPLRHGNWWSVSSPSSCLWRPAGRTSPLRPQRTYSCICWTAAFPSAAYFQLQAANTYLADFHPRTFALVDLTAYRSVYAGKRRLKEALEARLPDSHPFLYKGDVFLFLHEDEGAQAFDDLAEEFHLKVLISGAAGRAFLTFPSFTPPPGKRWS